MKTVLGVLLFIASFQASAKIDPIAGLYRINLIVDYCASERTNVHNINNDEQISAYVDLGQYERCIVPRLQKARLQAPQFALYGNRAWPGGLTVRDFKILLLNQN